MAKHLLAAVAAMLVLPTTHPQTGMAAEPEREGKESFDPQADALLKKMSDYLASLSSMRFMADHSTEVILTSGQKIELGASAEVRVRRPDRWRNDRVGQLARASFYYDGKTLTVHGVGTNTYAW